MSELACQLDLATPTKPWLQTAESTQLSPCPQNWRSLICTDRLQSESLFWLRLCPSSQ